MKLFQEVGKKYLRQVVVALYSLAIEGVPPGLPGLWGRRLCAMSSAGETGGDSSGLQLPPTSPVGTGLLQYVSN